MNQIKSELERIKSMVELGREPLVKYCGDLGKMSHYAAEAMSHTMWLIAGALETVIGDIDAQNTSENS